MRTSDFSSVPPSSSDSRLLTTPAIARLASLPACLVAGQLLSAGALEQLAGAQGALRLGQHLESHLGHRRVPAAAAAVVIAALALALGLASDRPHVVAARLGVPLGGPQRGHPFFRV